ncbi:MAG: hypothetical protein INR66_13035 [Gordonia polyisoprenivorans]|nr:hypothetical protein [Gordonia polyisoprenivorans]
MTVRSFSTDQLLASLPEVVEALRNPYAHHGEMRAHLVDCGDSEVRALVWCAWRCDLDLTGIPLWRVDGRVKGASTRTTRTHLMWIAEDVRNRLPVDDSDFHTALWRARLRSISGSGDVASIMSALKDEAYDAEFEEFRNGDAAIAG